MLQSVSRIDRLAGMAGDLMFRLFDRCICGDFWWKRAFCPIVACAVLVCLVVGTAWAAPAGDSPHQKESLDDAGRAVTDSEMRECMSRAETLHGKIDPDAKYYMYIYVLVWEDDLIPMNVGKPTRTGTSLFMAGLVKDQKKMRAAGIQPIVVGTDGDIMGERLVRLCKLHEFDVPVMSMSQAESLPGFEWGGTMPYVALVDRRGRELAGGDRDIVLDWRRVIQGKVRKKSDVASYVEQMPLMAGLPARRAKYYLYLNWNVCKLNREAVLEMVGMYPKMREAGVEMILCFWYNDQQMVAQFIEENHVDVPAALKKDADGLPGFWLRQGSQSVVLVDARGNIITRRTKPYLPDWQEVVEAWEREHPRGAKQAKAMRGAGAASKAGK